VSPSTYEAIHPDNIGFDILNDGKYPIGDVQVTISDLDFISKAASMNYEERLAAYYASMTNISIGTLSPHSEFIIHPFTFSKDIKKVRFNVNVSWRNGGYTHYAEFEREGPYNAFRTKLEKQY
jgi:hypothetical protein